MKQHKPIIIKIEENSFDRYINDAILHEGSCEIIRLPVRKRSTLMFIAKTIFRVFPLFFLRHRKIIIFDSEGVARLLSRYTNNRCVLYYWNVNDRRADVLNDIKRNCIICTFDKGEAQKYNLHFIPQFYIPLSDYTNTEELIKYDVFFVGVDKGRIPQIRLVQLACNQQRLSANLNVVVENVDDYSLEYRDLLLTNYMSYEKVLRIIAMSKALLEIVKEGQSGLTIRTMEALFYNKKLITNNVSIVNESFYNKNNVFILGKDKLENLSSFLSIKPVTYDTDFLHTHLFSTWLNSIIQLING